MLVVAFVLTLNNFFYAVNSAAAKPIFDWIDPFAVVALVLVFMEKILGSMRGETEWPRLVVTVLVGALVHLYAYNYLAKMAGSGLESGTLWLVMVPFTVSLLIYEGFLLIRGAKARQRSRGRAESSPSAGRRTCLGGHVMYISPQFWTPITPNRGHFSTPNNTPVADPELSLLSPSACLASHGDRTAVRSVDATRLSGAEYPWLMLRPQGAPI